MPLEDFHFEVRPHPVERQPERSFFDILVLGHQYELIYDSGTPELDGSIPLCVVVLIQEGKGSRVSPNFLVFLRTHHFGAFVIYFVWDIGISPDEVAGGPSNESHGSHQGISFGPSQGAGAPLAGHQLKAARPPGPAFKQVGAFAAFGRIYWPVVAPCGYAEGDPLAVKHIGVAAQCLEQSVLGDQRVPRRRSVNRGGQACTACGHKWSDRCEQPRGSGWRHAEGAFRIMVEVGRIRAGRDGWEQAGQRLGAFAPQTRRLQERVCR